PCSSRPQPLHSFPTRRSSDLTAPRTATARKATAILMVVIFICRGCKLVVPFMFHLEELLKPTSLRLPSVFSPRNPLAAGKTQRRDRKSTRLNSSHLVISYAVF